MKQKSREKAFQKRTKHWISVTLEWTLLISICKQVPISILFYFSPQCYVYIWNWTELFSFSKQNGSLLQIFGRGFQFAGDIDIFTLILLQSRRNFRNFPEMNNMGLTRVRCPALFVARGFELEHFCSPISPSPSSNGQPVPSEAFSTHFAAMQMTAQGASG